MRHLSRSLLTQLLSSPQAKSSPLKGILVLLLSISSGLAAYLIIYIVMKTRDKMRKKKEREENKMKELEGRLRIIMKELEIEEMIDFIIIAYNIYRMCEANFTLKFAFMKYQNKQVQNKDRKRQQLLTEFTSQVTQHYLNKHGGITQQEFEAVLTANATLRDQYTSLLKQFEQYTQYILFEQFKERQPEQLDVYIQNRCDAKSLFTIYSKYLAYVRYLVFKEN